MNLKRWTAVAVTALALVACGSPAAETVARVDNVILSRQELDQRIARIEQAFAQQPAPQGQLPSRQQLEQALVGQFVQQQLTLSLARQRGITVTDQEVDELIGQFRDSMAQQGITLEDAVQGQLGLSGPESSEFRQFVSSFVARQKLAETLVATDTVTVEEVHSAHILVETEEQARQVLDRLARGEKFEDLARELSKDPGSAANGGDLGWVRRGQFVPEFDKAIFEDLQPGETTQAPVQTQFGYHIIKVLERAQRPDPQGLQDRRQQALQQLIEEERARAKAEGRLEEPVYPTPVPEPTVAPAQPEGATPQPTAQP